jgi:DNA mismatch repair protein MutS
MLQQYFAVKAEHPGVLLAMRVGDFYEFYGEDAEIAAAALEITLTGREDGSNGRIPMAGVPFHSVEKYLARLVSSGHRVAICDQLEDPRKAKGLVKRGVTRVLTPGTLLEDSMLRPGQNNFLAALCLGECVAGLALLDPSTGEFGVTEVEGDGAAERILQELARIRPSELLVGPGAEEYGRMAGTALGTAVAELPAPSHERAVKTLATHFKTHSLSGFGCEGKPRAVVAAAMILAYAQRNRLALDHVDGLYAYSVDGFMRLDPATRRSLELTQNMADGSRRFTLLETLDETVTAMGARLLRRWIEQPLLDPDAIRSRHDAVARLTEHSMARGDLRDVLRRLNDLERLVSRIAANLAGPRDLAALRQSLQALPSLGEPLRQVAFGRLQELRGALSDHREVADLLARSIAEEPPHTVRDEGVIRDGYDVELDALRRAARSGKEYIRDLEQKEREQTGIASLKVGFNSVFGYYLEVPKREIAKVPDGYVRKQTTANAERYITAELKDQEAAVQGAQGKAAELEADIFARVRLQIAERSRELLQTARAVAEIDVLASLAETAVQRGYVRPEIVEEDLLEIDAGRHPVVEAASHGFVPNATGLGGEEGPRVVILTGPNMSGKSTYLRQNALIVLMAQIGAFVPAVSCRLSICDRIFARIGAKDELALGQSTFMVEMVESANILNHATQRSLVILDEVGRGTSTYDGLAIAWAMIEHLAGLGAKTMFATHYHQLNALADGIPAVANYRVAVEELGDSVVWTHRVLPGGTDRSYGIHVARMAGVPTDVLRRAQSILTELEEGAPAPTAQVDGGGRIQMTLFEVEEPALVRELKSLDVDRLTPIDALLLLSRWKRHLP